MGKSSLDNLISRMGDLPALPGVVAEVLSITENPNSAMTDVTEAIQSDPALTAKILRLSNSSYYGMRQQVGTLKLALVILGVREVRNIVLGISVFETLKDNGADEDAAQEVWTDSLRMAGMSKSLSKELGLGFQGEDFITGLLADMGKMLFLWQLKSEYGAMLRKYRHQPKRLLAEEVTRTGYTHTDAATGLAVRWNLPKTLSDSLWTQYPDLERPLKDAKDPRLAAVVRIAKAAHFADLEEEGTPDVLLDSEAWEVLDGARKPLPVEQRLPVLKEIKSALAEAPELAL